MVSSPNTISTSIGHGVTLGTVASVGTYLSPLTITTTGTVLAGGGDGVFGPGYAAWTLDNYGIVQSTAAIGVDLAGGGLVTNGLSGASTALIAGSAGGVRIGGSGGTVVNA